MQYKSKKEDLKRWLWNKNAKIYLILLMLLLLFSLFIIFTIKNANSHPPTQADTVSESETDPYTKEFSMPATVDQDVYKIRINKAKNFITVLKADVDANFSAYKTLRCSVNPNVEIGSFQISEKSVWRSMDNNIYAQYVSRIGPLDYIHSVPYSSQSPSSLISTAYNNLGNPAAMGSIYLKLEDARWIYENCKKNTQVEVYEDGQEEPQIALEEKSTLPYSAAYDPSDTAISDKVVKNKINYMKGVRDKEITVGTELDLWDGIYAVDVDGNDITKNITITGKADTLVPGRYVITYHLMDTYGTVLAYQSIIQVYAEEETQQEQQETDSPLEMTESESTSASISESTIAQ